MVRATILFGLGVALVASTASAQEPETVTKEIDAPKRSFEISTGVGYAQGTGTVTDNGTNISDFAGPGVEVGVEPGYRINPRWFVGGYGSFASYSAPDALAGGSVRGVSAGVSAQYHFDPMKRLDPWIGLGAGYRGVYTTGTNGLDSERHGIQLARVLVGIDVRASPGFALGPVVGMDATLFTARQLPGQSSVFAVPSDELNVTPFFFAGVVGRFDAINRRVIAGDRRVVAANF